MDVVVRHMRQADLPDEVFRDGKRPLLAQAGSLSAPATPPDGTSTPTHNGTPPASPKRTGEPAAANDSQRLSKRHRVTTDSNGDTPMVPAEALQAKEQQQQQQPVANGKLSSQPLISNGDVVMRGQTPPQQATGTELGQSSQPQV